MSVLFFVMLLSLGLDSTFAWAETFICIVEDTALGFGVATERWKVVLAT